MAQLIDMHVDPDPGLGLSLGLGHTPHRVATPQLQFHHLMHKYT